MRLVDGSLECKVCIILLYEAWVLKNDSLGPAVFLYLVPIAIAEQ